MTTAKINNIQLEIATSSNKAVDSLKKLGDALSSLKNASNSASTELQKIVKALDGFDNSKIKKLKEVADAINTLGKNGSVDIKITGLNNLQRQTKEVQKLNEEIKKVGGNTPNISADRVKEAMQSRTNAQNETATQKAVAESIKEVATNTSQATKELEKYNDELKKSKVWQWNKDDESVKRIRERHKGERERIAEREPRRAKNVLESLKGGNKTWAAKRQIDEMEASVRRLQELLGKDISADALKGFSKKSIDSMISTKEREKLKGLVDDGDTKKINTYALAVKAVDKAFAGLKKVAQVTLNVMKKVGNVFLGVGKTIGNQMFGGIRKLINAYESLRKRIATVFLRRVITASLRAIYKAMQEGIQNMYVFSQTARASFVSAMDQIATATNYAKNSLGAMMSPIIEAIAPAIDFLIDKFVALLNTINQVISLISGKEFWTKAKKNAISYGDSIKDAAGKSGKAAKKAAEDLKLWLAPWDELHLTNEPDKDNGSGGTGGGSGSGNNYDAALMFENVEYDSTLKDLIESGDWYGVGELLGEKLNTLTDKLDSWITDPKTQKKFKDFATNFGDAINGFVSKYDFGKLGTTLANGINLLVSTGTTWWNTVKWDEFGKKIGNMVAKFFDTVDWGTIGEDGKPTGIAGYFAAKFNAAIDFFGNAFQQIFGDGKAKKMGEKISTAIKTWFASVKWEEAGTAIKTGINGLIDTFAAIVDDDSMWATIEEKMNEFSSGLSGIKWDKLAKALGKAFVKVMDIIPWDEIGDAIGTFLGNLPWGDITKTMLENGWELIKSTIGSFFDGENGWTLAGILAGALGAKIATKVAGVVATKMALESILTNVGIKLGLTTAAQSAVSSTTLTGAIATALGVPLSTVALLAGGLVLTLALVFDGVKNPEDYHTPGLLLGDEGNVTGNPNAYGYNSDIGGMQVPITFDWEKGYSEAEKAIYDSWSKKSYKINTAGATKKNIEDTLTKTQVTLENGKKVTATIDTKGNITSVKKADALKDPSLNTKAIFNAWERDKNKFNNNIGMNANLTSWAKDKKNFNSNLTGMKANFVSWARQKGFSNDIKDLTAYYRYSQKQDGYNTGVYGLTAWYRYSMKQDGFDPSIYGLTGWFKYQNTQQGFDRNLYNMTAWFSSAYVKRNGGGNVRMEIKANGGLFDGNRWRPIEQFANGGMPSATGQMFIAREAGPELVGTIGGHTAVMNNDQIVSSVASGVAQAVSNVMSGQGSQPITVYLDGEVVYRNVVRRNNMNIQRNGTSELIY